MQRGGNVRCGGWGRRRRKTCDETFVCETSVTIQRGSSERMDDGVTQPEGKNRAERIEMRADEPTQNSRTYAFYDPDHESVPRYNVSQLQDKKPNDLQV